MTDKMSYRIIAFLMLVSAGNIGQPATADNCPTGWNQNRTSCYYTGEIFTGLTYYDAAAFCQSFGPKSHLVEINDMDEYVFVKHTAKTVKWTDGPWIGMLRLSDRNQYTLPSLHKESRDPTLNLVIEKLTWNDHEAAYQNTRFVRFPAQRGHARRGNCGGMNSYGNYLGFWDCTPSGSPWCEIDLA